MIWALSHKAGPPPPSKAAASVSVVKCCLQLVRQGMRETTGRMETDRIRPWAQIIEMVDAVGVRHRGHEGGPARHHAAFKQIHLHSGNARLARILTPVAVSILPDEVTDPSNA